MKEKKKSASFTQFRMVYVSRALNVEKFILFEIVSSNNKKTTLSFGVCNVGCARFVPLFQLKVLQARLRAFSNELCLPRAHLDTETNKKTSPTEFSALVFGGAPFFILIHFTICHLFFGKQTENRLLQDSAHAVAFVLKLERKY